jgi:hypothetical protein
MQLHLPHQRPQQVAPLQAMGSSERSGHRVQRTSASACQKREDDDTRTIDRGPRLADGFAGRGKALGLEDVSSWAAILPRRTSLRADASSPMRLSVDAGDSARQRRHGQATRSGRTMPPSPSRTASRRAVSQSNFKRTPTPTPPLVSGKKTAPAYSRAFLSLLITSAGGWEIFLRILNQSHIDIGKLCKPRRGHINQRTGSTTLSALDHDVSFLSCIAVSVQRRLKAIS